MADLSDILDVYFTEQGKQDLEIVGGATWRASLLGNCLRRQYLELVERRPIPAIDARTSRVFAVGHLTEALISEAFHALGICAYEEAELHDETLDVGAHVDFIIGGKVAEATEDHPVLVQAARKALVDRYGPELPLIGVELKSKSSRSFDWAKKKNEPYAGENQLIQAGAYRYLANKAGMGVQEWYVLSVSKDDLRMEQTPVTEEHEAEALSRLAQLNAARGAADLPCDCAENWLGKYCPYRYPGGCC